MHYKLKCTKCGKTYKKEPVYKCKECGGIIDIIFMLTQDTYTNINMPGIFKYLNEY